MSALDHHAYHQINFSIDQYTFAIFKLSGEESLSQPFLFEITLIIPIDTNINFNLYMSVRLTLYNHNNVRDICGIITGIQHLGLFDDHQIQIVILLQPLLARLQTAKSLQFFQNLSIKEIAQQMLQKIGYRSEQLKFHCNNIFPKQAYIVQAPAESDLAFMQRLLANTGISYWCSSENQHEILNFSDNNQDYSRLNQNDIYFIPPNGLNLLNISNLLCGYFYDMQVKTQLVPNTFSVRTFNPELSLDTLETNKSISLSLPIPILHQHISQFSHSYEEISQEVLIHARRAAIDNWQLSMKGNITLLSPGQIFHLNACYFHDNEDLDDDYFVIKMKHFAQQASNKYDLGSTIAYHNQATLIKYQTPYCDTLIPLPKVPACWMGHIESDSYYPFLDENGNYRLRVHYDITNNPNIHTNPVVNRMANYGSTSQYSSAGKHLPLAEGTEILLNCINGNLNKPIIIGTLPNFSFKSPVTAINKTQNKILSQQNNLFLLDDDNQQQKILLATDDMQNLLELDATADHSTINLITQQGSLNLTAYKDMILQCDNSMIEQCSNNWLHTAHLNYSVQTQNQSICYTAAKDQQLIATQNILIDAHNNLHMNSTQELVIKCGSNMHYTIRGVSANFMASQGKIIMNCSRSISLIGTGNGEIKLINNSSGLIISSDGTIHCFGNIIQLQSLSGLYCSVPPQAGEGKE